MSFFTILALASQLLPLVAVLLRLEPNLSIFLIIYFFNLFFYSLFYSVFFILYYFIF
jgi:hypothetical protein